MVQLTAAASMAVVISAIPPAGNAYGPAVGLGVQIRTTNRAGRIKHHDTRSPGRHRRAKISSNLWPVCVVPRSAIVQVNIITLCSNLDLLGEAYDGTSESKDDMDDRPRRLAKAFVILDFVIICLWIIAIAIFGTSGKQTSTFSAQSPALLILFALLIAAPLVLVGILLLRSPASTGIIVAALTSGVIATLVSFSSTYWQIGTTANFNIRLTHFDSWYFALGMFTTAGTGNIVAISDHAREIQTLQMIFDMIIVVFVAGILVSRFSDDLKFRRRNGASAHDTETANSGSPEEKA